MKAFFQWLNFYNPFLDECSFHIPNEGKRNPAIAKATGIRAGVPDIFIPFANGKYHGLFIEMKKPARGSRAGKITKSQETMIELLNHQGYLAIVCYGWEEAANEVKEYMRHWLTI